MGMQDRYLDFVHKYRYLLVLFSWISYIIAMYYGKNCFSKLSDNGYFSAKSKSRITTNLIMNSLNLYPDYSLIVLTKGVNGLTPDDSLYMTYYNKIVETLDNLDKVIGVLSHYEYPSDPRMLSDDKTSALIFGSIQYSSSYTNDYLTKKIEKALEIYGDIDFKWYLGGTIPGSNDINEEIDAGLAKAEVVTTPIIIVLLMISYGSVMASLMSIYTVIGTVTYSFGIIYGLSTRFRIHHAVTNVITMLGVGLSIDFSLLVVSRFMEERKKHPSVPVQEILKETFQTSGMTTITSSVLIAAALSGGLVFPQNYLSSFQAAIIVVAITAGLVTNLYLFAQLAILDEWVLYGQLPSQCQCNNKSLEIVTRPAKIYDSTNAESDVEPIPKPDAVTVTVTRKDGRESPPLVMSIESGDSTVAGSATTYADNDTFDVDERDKNFYYYIVAFAVRHKYSCFAATMCFLIAWTAYFFKTVKFGLVDMTVIPPSYSPRYVFNVVKSDFSHYGASTAYIVLRTKDSVHVTDAAFLNKLELLVDSIRDMPAVNNVFSMVSLGNSSYSYSYIYSDPSYASMIQSVYYPLCLSDLDTITSLHVALNDPYPCSTDNQRNVETLYKKINEIFPDDELQFSGVAGSPALCYDLLRDVQDCLPVWLCVLFGTTFVILLVLFKSLVIPIKAVAISVISLGCSLGILIRLFPNQTSEQIERVLHFQPTGYISVLDIVFIFSISFALTLDYEVFVLMKVLEIYKKCNNIEYALVSAVTTTGPVITSAAVMIAVVLFAFIGCDVLLIKAIGVGIAISIVLDATIVRLLLVPSFFLMINDYTWYLPEALKPILDYINPDDEPSSYKAASPKAISPRKVVIGE